MTAAKAETMPLTMRALLPETPLDAARMALCLMCALVLIGAGQPLPY
ncbi:MAG: hypothetical protein AAFX04_01950 [Pseudomonadota bacterium]